MAYPGNRDPRDPRDPRYNENLTDQALPGEINRDFDDPAAYDDPALRADPAVPSPRDYPRGTSAPRGIAGATLAIAIVLLAVIAFSFMGGADDETATVVPDTAPIGTDRTPTASITPDGAAEGATEVTIPPIAPADPAQPVQPAPR
jgi:hypothetical protein